MNSNNFRKKIRQITLTTLLSSVSLFTASQALAGDEVLSPVTDSAIAEALGAGNKLRISGVGLHSLPEQAGTISIQLNEGETVERVLLYWQVFDSDVAYDTELTLERAEDGKIVMASGEVIGEYVAYDGGSPHISFYNAYSATIRADITDLDIIQSGSNTLTITGLDEIELPTPGFGDSGKNGAGIMMIYSDSNDSNAQLQLFDGHDSGWWKGYSTNMIETKPVLFEFDASDNERFADLSMFVASVEGTAQSGTDRASIVEIKVGDNSADTIRDVNVLTSNRGDEWDDYVKNVRIPAGANFIQVQLYSETDPYIDPTSDETVNPASFVWLAAGLSVPQNVEQVCNCRPKSLTFKYVGGSCNADSPEGLLKCRGDLNSADGIDIKAFSRRSRGLIDLDNDWISKGETFTISGKRSHHRSPRLPEKTRIVLKNGHDKLVLKLDTSCEQPLATGDRFGPLVLVGFEAPEDCNSHVNNCRDRNNHRYHKKWNKWKHSSWYKGWKHHGG